MSLSTNRIGITLFDAEVNVKPGSVITGADVMEVFVASGDTTGVT
jgi:hypothetical protein